MTCVVHPATAAVGFSVSRQRGVCRACVGSDTPRIVCQSGAARGVILGSVAVGGVAVGFMHAVGGVAVDPSIISGTRCDAAARAFFERRGALPRIPSCR